MEAVVESVSDLPTSANIELSEISEKACSAQEDTCRKSNGVAESTDFMSPLAEVDNIELHIQKSEADTNVSTTSPDAVIENTPKLASSEAPISLSNDEVITEELDAQTTTACEVGEEQQLLPGIDIGESIVSPVEETKVAELNVNPTEEVFVESENVNTESSENVRFETEILVESNDVNEVEIDSSKMEDSTNNILNELGQNIELSEVLRSSDVTENANNNNCAVRQEVFNKEELLDILEGNDVQSPITEPSWEAQKAMEQLSRLKTSSRKSRQSDLTPKKAIPGIKQSDSTTKKSTPATKQTDLPSKKSIPKPKPKKEENIVKALVSDWDDEELPEDDSSKINETTDSTTNQTENSAPKDETVKTNRTSIDSATSDGQTATQNKANDESQPQRRLGRVIKKKVIFDPDNPDTYTKSKMHKNKESQSDKDPQPPKKNKVEQTVQRAKSKSPISKMQWKKPTPKNSNKAIKRLSEVDRLLMDEGAVNMIYQLTPEAPKGKKNMKTKAEFIKKLQSSTPEGKEMKFRERKKECKDEEAKKILGGKQRSSLSGSVKSPSACDDFETHSADDSIIYRRHSSSSYSSSCMSPRRLSDVDGNVGAANISQPVKEHTVLSGAYGDTAMDVDPQESPIPREIINKDDCLSLKKKLNSKLSLALNKRKRESSKTDKPIKKKIIKTDDGDQKDEDVEVDVFKNLSVTVHKGVAEISIRKTGSIYNADIFYELEEALSHVDSKSDVAVTVLTSECGTLCSAVDLTPLQDVNVENRMKYALHIAEAVRSVLSAVSRHSKIVVSCAWGACRGVGLALLALSDVALGARGASFALAAGPGGASLTPGVVAVLGARPLPQPLVNDLVIFARELSASEALQHGLISRELWPTGVHDQLQAIVLEIANQPVQTLLLKKKLMKIRTGSDNTFLAQLEAERALFVEYWSAEGQQDPTSGTDPTHILPHPV